MTDSPITPDEVKALVERATSAEATNTRLQAEIDDARDSFAEVMEHCGFAALYDEGWTPDGMIERLQADLERAEARVGEMEEAAEAFVSAYRARYMRATGHIRESAPMRDEVLNLNRVRCRNLLQPQAQGGGALRPADPSQGGEG